MTEELKPCPFCGCKEIAHITNTEFKSCLRCKQCKASTDFVQEDELASVPYKTIELWNARIKE